MDQIRKKRKKARDEKVISALQSDRTSSDSSKALKLYLR